MADKEERIMVGKIPNDVCVHQGQKLSMEKGLEIICYKKASGICNKKRCKIKQSVGITRQEAIEVMAKAICHHPYPSCEGCIAEKKKKACKQAFEGMKELAEAALNALLEGVK